MPKNPKAANLDLMIAAIKAEPDPILMGDFVSRNNACGTVACLAGWANLIRLNQVHSGATTNYSSEPDEYTGQLMDTDEAAEWMGIEGNEGDVFYNTSADDVLSPEDRREATIKLLELLKERPRWADWEDVLEYDHDTGCYCVRKD